MSDKISKISIPVLVSAIGVFLISSNMRTPITVVGPVISEMVEKIGLTNVQAGLLTSIPLFTWAAFSGIIGGLAHKFRMQALLMIALIFILAGQALRLEGGAFWLFFGTAIMGTAICITNVVLPAFVKKRFPRNLGLMTGVYTVGMNLIAAFASAYSVRIGEMTGYGWKGSLGVWIGLTLITIIFWLTQFRLRGERVKPQMTVTPKPKPKVKVYKSRLAWYISLYMGLQSMLYYVVVAWFPAILGDYGMNPEITGWAISAFLLATLPTTFAAPIFAAKLKNQKPVIWLLGILLFISFPLILIFKAKYAFIAAIIFGLSNGLSFSMAMLFFTMRTQSSATAVRISGMAQSIGYFIAGLGPAIFGKIFDLTHNWNYGFYFLLFISVLITYFGLKAAENRVIEADFQEGDQG